MLDDFRIIVGKRSIHVCNAPSPAATASNEIGKEVVRRIFIFEFVFINNHNFCLKSHKSNVSIQLK